MTAAADRHLLFGLLALQNGIINQGQLVAAFQAWTLDKARSLADHLEARGDLTSAKRALLEALAAVHLEAHGGDVEKSLAAVPAGQSTHATAWPGSATPTSRRRSPTRLGPGSTEPTSMMTPIEPPPTPSARPPATASGSASCGPTRAAAWAPSSSRSIASCTARWR